MLNATDIATIGAYGSQAVLLWLIVIASYTDLRFRKIYNRHTVSGFLLGIALAVPVNFPHGLWNALLASLLAFVLFFIMFSFGVMGGGDVKLAAAVGALIGYPVIIDAICWGSIFGGVYAIISLWQRGELFHTLRQLGRFVWNLLFWRIVTPPNVKGSRKIPYGLCIGAGALFAMVLKSAHHQTITTF